MIRLNNELIVLSVGDIKDIDSRYGIDVASILFEYADRRECLLPKEVNLPHGRIYVRAESRNHSSKHSEN
jgi:hypothetical protein